MRACTDVCVCVCCCGGGGCGDGGDFSRDFLLLLWFLCFLFVCLLFLFVCGCFVVVVLFFVCLFVWGGRGWGGASYSLHYFFNLELSQSCPYSFVLLSFLVVCFLASVCLFPSL